MAAAFSGCLLPSTRCLAPGCMPGSMPASQQRLIAQQVCCTIFQLFGTTTTTGLCTSCTAAPRRDETTVLALNGLGKVLRSNLASILAMAGFAEKWDELMTICTKALTSGRKAVAVAAAQLVTGVLQVSWLEGDLWQAHAELGRRRGT